jgi:hypothetical protein
VSDEQLDNWVGYHAPGSADVVKAHGAIRKAVREALGAFQLVIPECPDKTIALRMLVRAMWAANAAVACNHPDNCEPAPCRSAA